MFFIIACDSINQTNNEADAIPNNSYRNYRDLMPLNRNNYWTYSDDSNYTYTLKLIDSKLIKVFNHFPPETGPCLDTLEVFYSSNFNQGGYARTDSGVVTVLSAFFFSQDIAQADSASIYGYLIPNNPRNQLYTYFYPNNSYKKVERYITFVSSIKTPITEYKDIWEIRTDYFKDLTLNESVKIYEYYKQGIGLVKSFTVNVKYPDETFDTTNVHYLKDYKLY